MDDTWIVYETTPHALIDWLHELAAQARAEQRRNPHRSQVRIVATGAVDPFALPLPIRSQADFAGAIYGRLPTPAEPFGHPLLLLLVERVERRMLRVELAGAPEFPLTVDEVRWLLTRRFRHARRGASGRRTGLLLRLQRAGGERTGAPVLECNVWLEEQLARLASPRDKHKLFRPWLERYRALRGVEPADPLRSFRAAVAGCERRMQRRGCAAHAPGAGAGAARVAAAVESSPA